MDLEMIGDTIGNRYTLINLALYSINFNLYYFMRRVGQGVNGISIKFTSHLCTSLVYPVSSRFYVGSSSFKTTSHDLCHSRPSQDTTRLWYRSPVSVPTDRTLFEGH